jgi:hypothetical protein
MQQAYRVFSDNEVNLPIFHRAWWLDAVAGADGWDACIVGSPVRLEAALPFVIRRRHGLKILGQPQLTPYLGPWMRPTNLKYSAALAKEKEYVDELLGQLPAHAAFKQRFRPVVTNALPWHWKGFGHTTRYTYLIHDLQDQDLIKSNFETRVRTDCKKAAGRFKITIHDDLGIGTFIDVAEKTFRRQGMALPYSRELVLAVDAACEKRSCRKMLFARDDAGKIHAAIYLVWDADSAYYIMGGRDPELANSGGMTLALVEGIRFAGTITKQFDFEGSMIEPIEKFFRGFGARQVQSLEVQRFGCPLYRGLFHAAEIFRCLKSSR